MHLADFVSFCQILDRLFRADLGVDTVLVAEDNHKLLTSSSVGGKVLV